MAAGPFRLCVGCRTSQPKKGLIRVYSVADGRLGVDLGGGVGRGAYVCPRRVCLEQAVKRGELARCLKVTRTPVTAMALEELIRDGVLRKVAALLGLARRARKVASGAEAVDSAVKRHSARLILSAIDASASSVEKLRNVAVQAGITWVQGMGKEALGAALGTAPRTCVAVTDPFFAGAIISALDKIPVEKEAGEAAWSDRRVGSGAEPRKAWR
ncbi:putative ribosomal protein YlxQ [Candidatus Methylomirabilis lanthanidiphila]|uniref:Putative ribosomal protein YlxQ n=1 Tax=Candidatus Methylomirabilis lanthanidiphila TaxID=2211376 RepID=A0A564ZH03_9BACT|nr:DUF448 domain-containing protein [Candidatus Methylomirabilis lanthanidiphila]VUZ84433.1 putative ribosomal protein YlxQ [Candidatus Methylomirabilis lanthanidiphila]